MSLLFAGIIGTLFLGGLLFGLFDDDENSSTDDNDDNTTDNGVVRGTEGPDIVTLPNSADSPERVNLLGGDDELTSRIEDYVTILGGDGDDTIATYGVLNTIFGGPDSDTLSGTDSNILNGDKGNDTLIIEHGMFNQGEWGAASGGDDDDTINISTPALAPDYLQFDVGGVYVSGGAGADTINITYENVGEQVIVEGDDAPTLTNAFIEITDFNPDEDVLTVEVERTDVEIAQNVEVTLEQSAQSDGTYLSQITLAYEETAQSSGGTSVLTITSTSPFTLDDLYFVGV